MDIRDVGRRRNKKMKNMLKCSSLIRLVVIMIVIAFMASQVSDTYAGNIFLNVLQRLT